MSEKTILDRTLIMYSLGSFVSILFAYLNSILLVSVLPEVLFNQFLWVMCFTMCLRVKEKDSNIQQLRDLFLFEIFIVPLNHPNNTALALCYYCRKTDTT